MATNRDRAITAAIDLLAEEGIRSLTHLRVDERARLPRGSTSNAFRTREALLLGVCDHILHAELPAVAEAFAARTVDELVASLVGVFEELVGPRRASTAARMALFVEAGHDEKIRAVLTHGRATIEAAVLPSLVALRAPDPDLAVQVIAAFFEGLFLHVIGRRAEVDHVTLIRAAVTGVLHGGS